MGRQETEGVCVCVRAHVGGDGSPTKKGRTVGEATFDMKEKCKKIGMSGGNVRNPMERL